MESGRIGKSEAGVIFSNALHITYIFNYHSPSFQTHPFQTPLYKHCQHLLVFRTTANTPNIQYKPYKSGHFVPSELLFELGLMPDEIPNELHFLFRRVNISLIRWGENGEVSERASGRPVHNIHIVVQRTNPHSRITHPAA